MNIRFCGVDEVLANWNNASKAVLEAQDLDLQQRQAFAPFPDYDRRMGYLEGKADAFIEAAASDPDYLAASNVYPHFLAQAPSEDAIANTWKQHPQADAMPTSFREEAFKKLETALTNIAAKLGKPAPTAFIGAIKNLLP